MALKDEIRAGIGAHGLWKGRLNSAIQTGSCDVSPSVVQQDNQCAFGKWLCGPSVDPATRRSSEYVECKELHRKFHIAAASALSLALAGKKQEATRAMERGSEFAEISLNLTAAMTRWHAKVAAAK
jgi:chemoreceptor zinc-binding protein